MRKPKKGKSCRPCAKAKKKKINLLMCKRNTKEKKEKKTNLVLRSTLSLLEQLVGCPCAQFAHQVLPDKSVQFCILFRTKALPDKAKPNQLCVIITNRLQSPSLSSSSPDEAEPDKLGIEDVELHPLQHVAKQIATTSSS